MRIILSMRNSIDIIPDPTLKGLNSIFPLLSGIQPNSIVKLSQSKSYIYTRYTRPQSPTSSSNIVRLPSSLCQLNTLNPGAAQLTPAPSPMECPHLTAFVSQLDWQIVNNKAQRLEEEFLGQLGLVWNGALLPLFYDRANFVKLRVQCGGDGAVMAVGEGTQVQVVVQGEVEGNGNHQANSKHYFTHQVGIIPSLLLQSGNINKILIPRSHQLFQQPPPQHKPSKSSSTPSLTPIPSSIPSSSSSSSPSPVPPPALLLDQYRFQLHYNVIKEEKKQFPCHTTLRSVKEQMRDIKESRQSRDQGEGKGNKETQNQGLQRKKLVVQVEVVEDVQYVRELCQRRECELQTISFEDPAIKQLEQQKLLEQQYPKYETHKPPPQIPCNILFLSQALVTAYNISLAPQTGLHLEASHTPREQQPVSKKLDLLLQKPGFHFILDISQRQDTVQLMDQIKNNFVDGILNQLQQKGKVVLYGRVPWFVRGKKLGVPGFRYLGVEDCDGVLPDPLAIVYSPPKKQNKHNNIIKQQQQQIIQDPTSKLKQKLLQSIKLRNYFYEDQNSADVKPKMAMMTLLDHSIASQSHKMKKSQPNFSQKFMQLYQICYEQQIKKLQTYLSPSPSPSSSTSPSPPPSPILISSISNNGKTILHKIIQSFTPCLYIDMSQLDDPSLNLPEIQQYLQLVFQMWEGTCIFFDNLDSVCSGVDAGDMLRSNQRVVAKIVVRAVLGFGAIYRKLCVCTVKNQTNLDPQFTNYQLIKLKNPSRQTRLHTLTTYQTRHPGNPLPLPIPQLLLNTESTSFGQFSKYIITGHLDSPNCSSSSSPLTFSKLAGVRSAKKILRGIVERPLKYSFVFKKLPIKLSRGVLLYGGSGTGKSAIGEALAGQFKMKFFTVKGSDILSKYIGGSQAAVRDVFQKAMSVSPSIIFFDQFQSIVPRRNSSNTGVTDRVVNQFLCYLDGVASVEGVFIVAASSRPEMIDPALLRPGRIDTHIYLDYPSEQDRMQLFQLYKNSIKFQQSLQQLVEKTNNYSYSDLIGLLNQLRIKKSSKILKQHPNISLSSSSPSSSPSSSSSSSPSPSTSSSINSSQFKYIQKQFFEQIYSSYRVSVSKENKDAQKNRFMKFQNGEPIDVRNQKVVLQ